MEISSFLSTEQHGTECCVAPTNGFVRDALDEEGTEALAAGFAALFQLMLAPASPASDPSAGEGDVSSGNVGLASPATSAIAPTQPFPAGTADATTTAATSPSPGLPLVSDLPEAGPGESSDLVPATRGTDDAPTTEGVAEPVGNRVAGSSVPAIPESASETPSPPQPADLFLRERQGDPAPAVAAESIAPPAAAPNTRPESMASAGPEVAIRASGPDQRAADASRNAAPPTEMIAQGDIVAEPSPLARPIQDTAAAAATTSRSARAAGRSVLPTTVEEASAAGSQSTAPELEAAPQTASLAGDDAAEWSAETSADGTEFEPPREDRVFEDREAESWLDSLTGAGSDGTLTIQELAAWQTFGREQSFEQSRQETASEAFVAGPVRKSTGSTPRAIDTLTAALPGTSAREAAAATPAVVAQGALPSFALEEIVSHVRTDESDGVSRVEAQIDPPELGRMWIEITKSAEGVKAHLTVEDPAVWNLLETAAAEMRQSLQDSGVPMAGLTLSLGRDGGSSSSGSHAGDPNGESRRDEDSYATVTGAAQRRARPKRQVDTIV